MRANDRPLGQPAVERLLVSPRTALHGRRSCRESATNGSLAAPTQPDRPAGRATRRQRFDWQGGHRAGRRRAGVVQPRQDRHRPWRPCGRHATAESQTAAVATTRVWVPALREAAELNQPGEIPSQGQWLVRLVRSGTQQPREPVGVAQGAETLETSGFRRSSVQIETARPTEHCRGICVLFDVIHELPEIDIPGPDLVASEIQSALKQAARTAAHHRSDVVSAVRLSMSMPDPSTSRAGSAVTDPGVRDSRSRSAANVPPATG